MALDTNCFVYFLQGPEYPAFHALVKPFFIRMEKGDIRGIASVLALAEVLVKPKKDETLGLANRIYLLLKDFPNLRFLPVDEETALLASTYRAKYGCKMPDAIHLATASMAHAQEFLTNDKSLRLTREVPVTILSDLAQG